MSDHTAAPPKAATAPQSSQTAAGSLRSLAADLLTAETKIRLGGGPAAIERQHEKGGSPPANGSHC